MEHDEKNAGRVGSDRLASFPQHEELMKDIRIDLQPAKDLAQAEHEAADNLTQAEGDDDARRAAVTAGTRRPPGSNERPYLEVSRSRAATHETNSAEITRLLSLR